MNVLKGINTLAKTFKTGDRAPLIYSSFYFALSLIKLFLLPIITVYIMKSNYLISTIIIVIYFIITYALILIKEMLIDASNSSRMKRIEESYSACIKINYEFFESKEGRSLFLRLLVQRILLLAHLAKFIYLYQIAYIR